MNDHIPPAVLERERQQNELAAAMARRAPLATKVPTSTFDELLKSPRYMAGGVCDAEIAGAAEHFRTRSDEAFALHGVRAPQIESGEPLGHYRQRLLNNLKLFAKESPFKTVDFRSVHASNLAPFEAQLIDQAVADFKKPVGPLRQMIQVDDAGRKIRRYFGDPEACWGQFKGHVQRVTRWNTDLGRGANAPGANKPVAMLMADGPTRRLGA
jgi:hypothetical protein